MKVKKNRDQIRELVVLGALVHNNQILNSVALWEAQYQEDLFLSDAHSRIADWCIDHYRTKSSAPGLKVLHTHYYEPWEEESGGSDKCQMVAQLLSRIGDHWNEGHFKRDQLFDLAEDVLRRQQVLITSDRVGGSSAARTITDVVPGSVAVSLAREPEFDNFFDNPTIAANILESTNPVFTFPDEVVTAFYGDTFAPATFVQFAAPEKRGKCVAADTEVVMDNGEVMTIEEIVTNHKTGVASYNEEIQRFELDNVTEWHDSGKKKCYEVTTRTGKKLKTSKDHGYLTPDGWKDLSDLKEGDFIAVAKKCPVFGQDDASLSDTGIKYLMSHMMWDQIESIEYAGKLQTYDIAVEGNHNFVANGFIVHNSQHLLECVMAALKCKKKVLYFDAGDMTEEQVFMRFAARALKKPYVPGTQIIFNDLYCDGERVLVDREEVEWEQGLTQHEFNSVRKKCVNLFKGKLFTRSYPRGALSVDTIRSIIDNLSMRGITIDVVVIDYADILRPTKNKYSDNRHAITEIWGDLRTLSSSYKLSLITATQTDASTYTADIGQGSFSESKTKYAFITAEIGINKTEEHEGVFKLSYIFRRTGSLSKSIYIASDLSTYRPIVKAMWVPKKDTDGEKRVRGKFKNPGK